MDLKVLWLVMGESWTVHHDNVVQWPVMLYARRSAADRHAERAQQKATEFHKGVLQRPQPGWNEWDPRMYWMEFIEYSVVPVPVSIEDTTQLTMDDFVDLLAANVAPLGQEVCLLCHGQVLTSHCSCS